MEFLMHLQEKSSFLNWRLREDCGKIIYIVSTYHRVVCPAAKSAHQPPPIRKSFRIRIASIYYRKLLSKQHEHGEK